MRISMWLLLQLEAVGGAYDSPYTRAVAGSNPAAPTMCDQHVRVLHDRLVLYDYPAEHWIHLRTTKIRSSRLSPPSGTGPRSPAGRGHVP